MIKRYLFFLSLFFSVALAPDLSQAGFNNSVIVSNGSPLSEKIVKLIIEKTNDKISKNGDPGTKCRVTIGDYQDKPSLENTEVTNIAVFVSPYEYRQHGDKYYSNIVYSEPNPLDVVSFINNHFGKVKVGYLFNVNDEFTQQLTKALGASRLELISMQVDDDPFAGLRKLNNVGIDVLLVNKNSTIYRTNILRFIFEAMYRKGVPIVSTTDKLTDLGAVASIYLDIEAIAEKIAYSIVKDRVCEHVLEIGKFSRDFKVRFNKELAKKYGISLEVSND